MQASTNGNGDVLSKLGLSEETLKWLKEIPKDTFFKAFQEGLEKLNESSGQASLLRECEGQSV